MRTSTRTQHFPESIIREMTRIALDVGAINLSQGYPDFAAPQAIKDAAAQAIQDDWNQYSVTWGLKPLRDAIADHYRRRYEMDVNADTDVVVCCGATECMIAAMLGVVNPGDEVIFFEPYYESYIPNCFITQSTPRFVSLRPSAGGAWEFDSDELRRAFNAKTKVIIINSPHNPTGKVFTRDELSLIAALCLEHGVTAITDEVYERLVYDPAQRPHLRLATLPGMADRTVTLSSLGKTFSLTGWKIGWAIAPPHLTAAIRAAHQFITFATATPLQVGAAAALEHGEPYVLDLVERLRTAREFLGRALEDLGFRVFRPAGTYFIMADHSALRMGDDVEFCRRLTAEFGVAAIPPSVFYEHPEHGRPLARFAFCKKMETLEQAVERLARLRR